MKASNNNPNKLNVYNDKPHEKFVLLLMIVVNNSRAPVNDEIEIKTVFNIFMTSIL